MINSFKRKLALKVFFISACLLIIQVGLFTDLNKDLVSKEYLYNYQLDRWQTSVKEEWRILVNNLRDSGLTLCDKNGASDPKHRKLLNMYYQSMYDILVTSKHKFNVSTYIFSDTGKLFYSLVEYWPVTYYLIPKKDFDDLNVLMKKYKVSIEKSKLLMLKAESNLKKLKGKNLKSKHEVIYNSICTSRNVFFNEESLKTINQLNSVTNEVLKNYSVMYDAYIKLSSFLLGFKLWLTIMLFITLQWLIMRKEIET